MALNITAKRSKVKTDVEYVLHDPYSFKNTTVRAGFLFFVCFLKTNAILIPFPGSGQSQRVVSLSYSEAEKWKG